MSIYELIGLCILVGLMVYNFRLSLAVKKLKQKIGQATLMNLMNSQNQQLMAVVHEKKRWGILSEILIFASFMIAIFGGNLLVLLYFLILYTITTIYINHLTEKTFKNISKLD
ncbi:hypothetical protein [Liquorilactobacillus vini]|nr:hypothetical protein [Liquorilactobacillus vini]